MTAQCEHNFEYIVVDCDTKKVTIPNQAYTIGTQGDHGVTDIHFMLFNRPSRIDPADCTVKIKYTNALGEDGEADAVDVVHDSKTMLVTFPVPDDLVKKGGKVKVGITLESGVYRWNVAWIKLYVQPFRKPTSSSSGSTTPVDPDDPIGGITSDAAQIIADLKIRVQRLENKPFEIPQGYIEKDHLSQGLKDELAFDSDFEAMDSSDVEALWNI